MSEIQPGIYARLVYGDDHNTFVEVMLFNNDTWYHLSEDALSWVQSHDNWVAMVREGRTGSPSFIRLSGPDMSPGSMRVERIDPMVWTMPDKKA